MNKKQSTTSHPVCICLSLNDEWTVHEKKRESKERKKVEKVGKSQIHTSKRLREKKNRSLSLQFAYCISFPSFFILLLSSWTRRIKEISFLLTCLERVSFSPPSASSLFSYPKMAGGRLQQQAITLASSTSFSFSSTLCENYSLPLRHLLSSSSSAHAGSACRALSLAGVHTPHKTLGKTCQRNVMVKVVQPAVTFRLLPSHQRFLHSSSGASPFSLLSLESPLSPSSEAFARHIDHRTQQYRTLVTVRQPTHTRSIRARVYLSLYLCTSLFLIYLSICIYLSIAVFSLSVD